MLEHCTRRTYDCKENSRKQIVVVSCSLIPQLCFGHIGKSYPRLCVDRKAHIQPSIWFPNSIKSSLSVPFKWSFLSAHVQPRAVNSPRRDSKCLCGWIPFPESRKSKQGQGIKARLSTHFSAPAEAGIHGACHCLDLIGHSAVSYTAWYCLGTSWDVLDDLDNGSAFTEVLG